MKKLFTLLLVLIACSVSAIDMGPYDPGAARKSDLGTMAAEAATDYVATDTFTGHTGATGASVHGLGTISTFASTDYVATSSLAERLDTGNASFSGDIDVTNEVKIATSTDAGDYKLQVDGDIYFDGNQTNMHAAGVYKFAYITLADDGTADLQTLLELADSPLGRVDAISTSGVGYAAVYVQGGINTATSMQTGLGGQATDTDGNLCVFSAGSSAYTVKNRLGSTAGILVKYQGRK